MVSHCLCFSCEPLTLGCHVLTVDLNVLAIRILDIDATVIAQQITLFQHYLFSKIKGAHVCFSAVLSPSTSKLTISCFGFVSCV